MAGQKSLLPVELARRQMLDPRMAQFMPGMVTPNVLEMMAQAPPQQGDPTHGSKADVRIGEKCL